MLDKETLQRFEDQCVQDEPPACQTMCPLHFDARGFLRFMAQGRTGEARKVMDRYLPLSQLCGYLCEGPCQAACRRAELDQGLNLPLLERHCLNRSRAARFMPLPATGKKMAVFGAGLSSLALAWELGRKGHRATVYHLGPVGGRLNGLPPEQLPPAALAETLANLEKVKTAFERVDGFSPDLLRRSREEFQAVYLGFDDAGLTPESLGLTPEELRLNPVTLGLELDRVFARPPAAEGGHRFIDDLAAAKRAGGSIERIVQGGSPETARAGEETYPTRLFTSLEGVETKPFSPPADPWRPTEEEALAEAGRCLDCQCLECVKKCVYLRHYKGYPKKTAREAYSLISTAFGIHTANTMVLSCAECGLCREVCPNGADMGYIIDLLRRQMVETCHMPVSAHEFALEDMLHSNAGDVSFFRRQPGSEASRWLFFPGCQLVASRPEATAEVYCHLAAHLEGGVGFMSGCCGAPARWSGRPRLTATVAAGFRRQWEEAGRPTVVTACASCALFFQAELPEMELRTLWSLLPELPLPAGAAPGPPLALHDPCAARMDGETLRGVRTLLEKLGQPFSEPPLTGRFTRCCGYGGLAASAHPVLADQFARERIEDVEGPLAAYCAMCRDRLRAAGRPALHVLDLLFPQGGPDEVLNRPEPGLSDRQEARRAFRRTALTAIWGEQLPEDLMTGPVIHISEELAPKLESRRILRSDLARVLAYAEEHGAQFVNRDTGRCLTSLRPRQVTFWVEFSRREDGGYDVHDAYCHRMAVPGVEGEGLPTAASGEGFDPMGGRR